MRAMRTMLACWKEEIYVAECCYEDTVESELKAVHNHASTCDSIRQLIWRFLHDREIGEAVSRKEPTYPPLP